MPTHRSSVDLATVVDDVLMSPTVPATAIVGLEAGHPSTFAVAALPGHPLDTLVGFRAPPSWWGLVVVGAFAPTGSVAEASGRIAHGIDRSGVTVTRFLPAGAVTARPRFGTTDLVDDACRRALGLPTRPPQLPVGLAIEIAELDRLVALAIDGRLGRADLRLPVLHEPTWSELRNLAADRIGDAEIRRWLAWADEGVMSRFVHQRLPEPTDLVTTLADLVDAGLLDAALASCPRLRSHLAGTDSLSA
ncbi:MAG: hypothetical protein OEV40_12945 [Acidimicrobiia bacterium]|nr:hypothetical protein [Acidimicrobiia bacterium]